MAETEKSWFGKLKAGLAKTSGFLGNNLIGVLTRRKLDQQMLDDLSDVLLQADMGFETADRLVNVLKKARFEQDISLDEIKSILAEDITRILQPVTRNLTDDLATSPKKPQVILVVGVNGNGKTTTIGKLAWQFKQAGKKVTLVAGDTFRAAAVEQLRVWSERAQCPLVTGPENADAAAVAYQGLQQAITDNSDIVMIDTAGRLHNRTDLMEELSKITRVLKKLDDTAPHHVLLVLDATTGQNAVQQADVFKQLVNISGLILTKLDGSAKGGVVVSLANKFQLPIYAIGVGEGIDDLRSFNADDFAKNLLDITTL